MEQTFFIIKPDAIKRGLVGQILSRVDVVYLSFVT